MMVMDTCLAQMLRCSAFLHRWFFSAALCWRGFVAQLSALKYIKAVFNVFQSRVAKIANGAWHHSSRSATTSSVNGSPPISPTLLQLYFGLCSVLVPSPNFMKSHNLVSQLFRQFLHVWSHVVLDTTHYAKFENTSFITLLICLNWKSQVNWLLLYWVCTLGPVLSM